MIKRFRDITTRNGPGPRFGKRCRIQYTVQLFTSWFVFKLLLKLYHIYNHDYIWFSEINYEIPVTLFSCLSNPTVGIFKMWFYYATDKTPFAVTHYYPIFKIHLALPWFKCGNLLSKLIVGSLHPYNRFLDNIHTKNHVLKNYEMCS